MFNAVYFNSHLKMEFKMHLIKHFYLKDTSYTALLFGESIV